MTEMLLVLRQGLISFPAKSHSQEDPCLPLPEQNRKEALFSQVTIHR